MYPLRKLPVPFPRPSPPKPRQLPQRARMTIAAGFKCTDGILLASDTMYSGAVQNTFGPKFWIVRKHDPAVVFGGTGTVGALTRARREMKRAIRKGMKVNDVLDATDDVLRRINEKFPSQT